MDNIFSRLTDRSTDVVGLLPDLLKLLSTLTDAQLAVFEMCLRVIEKAVDGSNGQMVRAQCGPVVNHEVIKLSSHVSSGSSASSSRAKRRAAAKARKAKALKKKELDDAELSNVTYTCGPPVVESQEVAVQSARSDSSDSAVSYARKEQVVVVSGHCYLALLEESCRSVVTAKLGSVPTFEQVLGLPNVWLRGGWEDMQVSRTAHGTYHVDSEGAVSARICLTTVAARAKRWPAGSIGDVLSSTSLQVSRVFIEKAPMLSDVLAGEASFVSISPQQFEFVATLKKMVADQYGLVNKDRERVVLGGGSALQRVVGLKPDCVDEAMQEFALCRPVRTPGGFQTTVYADLTRAVICGRWVDEFGMYSLQYTPTPGRIKLHGSVEQVSDVLHALQEEVLVAGVFVYPTRFGSNVWGLLGSVETCAAMAKMHGWTMMESFDSAHMVYVV